MKIACFNPFSGIAGDMTVGAFLDLGMPLDYVEQALADLPFDGYRLASETVRRGAFNATRFSVAVKDGHAHRKMADVREVLTGGGLPKRVVKRSLDVFFGLATAEGRAHGKDPEEVHFHEVGAIDAIVDIVGAALGLEYFGVEQVFTTRVRVGTGEVECRHGLIPVPAPATIQLLAGVPILMCEGEGETATPTGAALLSALATPVPPEFEFVPGSTGYGAGTREDTPLPNLLRITLGELEGPAGVDRVVELRANIDDQSAEGVGYAMEALMRAGALDVWCTPALMKKGRPGVVLSVLAGEVDVAGLEQTLFAETTTFGVRRSVLTRAKLVRETVEVGTPWGTVRVKVGRRGESALTRSPEYEDCARIAREAKVPLKDVFAAALAAISERS